MAVNTLTVMLKMSRSVSVLRETVLPACWSRWAFVKNGCFRKRNFSAVLRHRADMFASASASERPDSAISSSQSTSFSNAMTRKYAPWASPDFVPDLQRFLSEIGTDPKEARFWLKQFLNIDQQKPFAVIEVDCEVLADSRQLEEFTSSVSFLHRNSLRPILVFSGVPDGEDVSDISFQDLNKRSVGASCLLSETLEKNGVRVKVLYAGSNTVQAEQDDRRGAWKVRAVNPDLIQWCLARQAIPIIPAFGETHTGQIVPLDAWDVTTTVAVSLQPLKIIKVNCTGGVKDEDNQVIANINLPFDLQAGRDKVWCTPGVTEMISEVSTLLSQVPDRTSVVITAADKVLQELFTHRGSGTFLKFTEPIRKYHSLEEIDLERLTDLLNKSFQKTLSSSYFGDVKDLVHTVYVSEKYTGAALILNLPECDVPYLCKFAVSAQAQGEGIGDLLWDAIRKDFKQLFWRSRGSNPINQWYFKKSEGSWSDSKWTVFWYGIPEPTLSPALIKRAALAPESFVIPRT